MAQKEMKRVWICADAIVSPLGNSTSENFTGVVNRRTGVKSRPGGIVAGHVDFIGETEGLTRFEQLCLSAINAITNSVALPKEKIILVLSTTKGNVRQLSLPQEGQRRLALHETAKFIADRVGVKDSVTVSNACISGIAAMVVAKRWLASGKFDHALVVGADELSDFVISGFQSLAALSNQNCKPFDAGRDGINLGEAAAAVLLSVDRRLTGIPADIQVLGSAITNDANHISGPSRTGEELSEAIKKALGTSNLSPGDIDFISGHGTATMFNDEMEAKALNLSKLSVTPINSLKGYYGHTLGAAGVVEAVIGFESLRANCIVSTLGFERLGVSMPVNVTTDNIFKPISTFIKTASGFGGCNAAIVFQQST